MPELPEVETVARTLAPVLTGKRIESFELRWHRTLATIREDEARRLLTHRYVTSVHRRAKLILVGLDSSDVLTVHLRMTGELLFRPDAGEPRPGEREPYLRALLGLSDHSELVFYDTRKFGRITWLPSSEIAAFEASFGVEPLSSEFTVQALARLLGSRQRQIKPLLLDQRVIAGLGNIYVDEALFQARINPLTRSDLLAPDRVEALHDAIVSILQGAVDRHGTTFSNYRNGLGEPGGNQSTLLVYGQKAGTACPRCGAGLERRVVGQRGTVFCPNCQPISLPSRMPNR